MKEQRFSVLHNAILLSTSSVFLQILGFFYRMTMSRLAGAESMGVYGLVMSVYSLIMAFSLSGVRMAVTNLSAVYDADKNEGMISRLMRFAFKVFFLFFIPCLVASVFFSDLIGETVLGDARTSSSVALIGFCILLTGVENLWKALFYGRGMVKYVIISEISEHILRLVSLALLLWICRDSRVAVKVACSVGALTIGEIFSSCFLTVIYFVLRVKSAHAGESENISRKVMSYAFPISVSGFVTNLISSAGTVLLPQKLVAAGCTRSFALAQIGVVSNVIYPFLMLPGIFTGVLSNLMMPRIAAANASKDMKTLSLRIEKCFRITSFIAFAGTGLLLPVSKTACRLIFSQEIGGELFLCASLCVAASYFASMSAMVLNGLGRSAKTMIHSIVGEALQLALVLVLVTEKLGIFGVFLAGFFSAIAVSVLNIREMRSVSGLRFRAAPILLYPFITGVAVMLMTRFFQFGSSLMFGDGIVSCVSTVLLGGTCSLALLYIQGAFPSGSGNRVPMILKLRQHRFYYN